MKIAFNARLLNAPTLRGWNRYTVNLLAQLPSLGVELFLYGDQPIHANHLPRLPVGSWQVRVEGRRYARWEQFWLPRQCERDRVDLLHCPLNFGLPWFSPCPRVLTLHDAIDHAYIRPNMTWRDRLRPGHLRDRFHHWVARSRAQHVITASEHAQGDLVRRLGLARRKVTPIPEAADPLFHEPVSDAERRRVREKCDLARRYLFYVGGWERRKNVPFLLRAFATARLAGVELVLAGGRDEERTALLELAGQLGVGGRVRLLGWVEEEDLPALYAGALAFVYPSEYEGFGLQACEAMAVGCPLLAARATSLPEVVGDGGETFALDDTGELVELLRRVGEDERFRDELRCRGLSRSEEFSWQATARRTRDVYERVLQPERAAVPALDALDARWS
jgi:glycosyltransferase involved in cell wall biosynthesis